MTTHECEVEYVQLLDDQGNLKENPGLSDDDIKTIYWNMNLGRVLDQKMLNLQKQGRLGTFASVEGQEGCQAALAFAIKDNPNVWLTPSFRENVVMLARGVPMELILQYWGGYESGSKMDPSLKVLPVSIPVGSQALHATGIAMAMNIKGEKGAAISFFGDGATSEGEVHEAMNFAGVFNAPVIFFCQNNQYAISTPRKHQTASKTLAQKAFAYGFKGVQVDGNDIFAVYKVVKEAVDKAMNGGGPTFIEAITYRLGHHTTADDWKKYRDEKEVEEWKKRDPVGRLRQYMMKKGIWNDEQEQKMLSDAQTQVEDKVKGYETMKKPKVEEIFDYLYEKIPPILQEQKDYFVKFWGEQ